MKFFSLNAIALAVLIVGQGCSDPAPPDAPSTINESGATQSKSSGSSTKQEEAESADASGNQPNTTETPEPPAPLTNQQLYDNSVTECATKTCKDGSTGCYVDLKTFKCTEIPVEKFPASECIWDDTNLKKADNPFAANQITDIQNLLDTAYQGYTLKSCINDDATNYTLGWVKGTSPNDWVVQYFKVPR